MNTLQDIISNPCISAVREAVAATLAEIGADRADYLSADADGVVGSPDDRACPQLADAFECCPDGLELDVFEVYELDELTYNNHAELRAELRALWRAEVERQLASQVVA